MATSIEDLTARAKALVAERSYQEAVRACRRVLVSRPQLVDVRILLGMALLSLKRHDEVRAEMLAVLRRSPDEGAAHRLLGEAYLRDGQPEKAALALGKALELDPSDIEARDLLQEVAEEDRPPMETIDRWFDPESIATMQTELPPWREDDTGERALPLNVAPSVELDPDLQREIEASRTLADVSSARVEFDTRSDTVPDRNGDPYRPAPVAVINADMVSPLAEAPRRPGRDKPGELRQRGVAARFGDEMTKEVPFNGEPPPREPPPDAFEDGRVSMGSAGPTLPDEARRRSIGYLGRTLQRPGPMEDDSGPPVELRHRRSSRPPGRPNGTEELDVADLEESLSAELDVGLPPLEGDETQATFESSDPDADTGTAQAAGETEPPTGALDAPEADELPGEATYARIDSSLIISGGDAGESQGPPGFALPPGMGEGAGASPSSSSSAPASPQAPGMLAQGPGMVSQAPGMTSQAPGMASQAPGMASQAPGMVSQSGSSVASPASRGPAKKAGSWRLFAVLGALGVLALLSVGALVAVWALDDESGQVEEAAQLAAQSGAGSDLEEALRLAQELDGTDPSDIGLRARLLATSALEHGTSTQAEAASLLAAVTEAEGVADGMIAAAYLDLLEGRFDDASGAVEGDVEETPELAFARARVAYASRDFDEAKAAAQRAVSSTPSSPRYLALLGLATAMGGAAREGLEVLETSGAAEAPAMRIARARVLYETGSDPERALEEANRILGATGAASTQQEAWAHLLLAQDAASRGDLPAARNACRLAYASAPQGDEEFLLTLVETYLAADDPEGAQRAVQELPATSSQEGRRALVLGELYLLQGDFDQLRDILSAAPESARASYLRGRELEESGELSEAQEAYEAAAEDRSQLVRANVQLAGIHLRAGNAQRAIRLLEPAAEASPSDPKVVPLLTRALIERGEDESLARADELTAAAVEQRSGSASLLAARGQLLSAQGNPAEAVELLEQALELRPSDETILITAAEVSEAAGNSSRSRELYDNLLAQNPTQGRALLGLAHLVLDAGTLEEAEEVVGRAGAGAISQEAAAGLEARLQVLRGDGELALEALRQAARGSRSVRWHLALGRALYQAERDREATEAYLDVLRLDEGNAWAMLGMAEVRARASSGRARRNLASARRLGEAGELPATFFARLKVVEARLSYNSGDFSQAKELAEEAIRLDPSSAEAHLMLGAVATEIGGDPTPHFRAAVEARSPPPEALARLAQRLPEGDEACALATRYIERAPEGFDAPDVQGILRGCPRD